jgi:hypothetical protein
MEAIVLMHEVGSVAGTYLRSSELERSKTEFKTAEDVVAWIVSEIYPRFEQLDVDFRENQQRMWIGQL